ncbi:MAG: GNAT family N-acetyltransferase, partial [Alphaproteobacteria bacterium]|nr:GNAT family N-acetyltransferase [Alphaproteobacteria bacterium]
MTSSVTIKEVTSKSELKQFVKLPWSIFKDDPLWVPPLIMERMDILNQQKNPYFEHARAKMWLARKDGKNVGRITAQLDELVEQYHHEKIGHFGFFDCINDQQVADALLDTACDWLKAEGCEKIIGPFSLSINEETGMLIEGFDTPPSLMMNHALPYFKDLMTGYGMEKAKDLWAFYRKINQEGMPPA